MSGDLDDRASGRPQPAGARSGHVRPRLLGGGQHGAFRNVVFDLGGVLIDWNPRYLYRKLIADDAEMEGFLAEVTTPEWNVEQDRGRPWTEAVAKLTAQFPEHADLIEAYHTRWHETIGGPIDGTVDVLRELRSAGVGLYALTNWSDEKFDEAYPRFEFLSWFDGIVVSGKEKLVKPDPKIFHVLFDRYGIDPPLTVYIDDNPPNVQVARDLGMTALPFTDPRALRGDLVNAGVLPAPEPKR